jgi:hypothetical protein
MARQAWRARRVAVTVAVGAAVIGVSGLFVVLGIRNQQADDTAVLPPIMPTADAPYATSEPPFRIPAAFTAADDARAKIPLTQPEVHWVFADGPNLPPLVSPCGGYLPSDGARVGAHQLALVSPNVWKLRRVVVYTDVAAAQQAMSERRSALQQCTRHDEGSGISTVWIWQSQQIGDEAFAIGSQRYRGSNALPGHHRGVVMRQGRTLVMYLDYGQSRVPPTIAEVGPYANVAKPVATELASASWNQ